MSSSSGDESRDVRRFSVLLTLLVIPLRSCSFVKRACHNACDVSVGLSLRVSRLITSACDEPTTKQKYVLYCTYTLFLFHPPPGYYSGLLVSSFMVGRFTTSYMWGVLADRHGRLPVLYFGLLSTAILSIGFGVSTTMWWAIICRCVCVWFMGAVGRSGCCVRRPSVLERVLMLVETFPAS